MWDDPLDQNGDDEAATALLNFYRRNIEARPPFQPRPRFEVQTDVQMFGTHEMRPLDPPKAAPSVEGGALQTNFPQSFNWLPVAVGFFGVWNNLTLYAYTPDFSAQYAFNGTVTVPVDTAFYTAYSGGIAIGTGTLFGLFAFDAASYNMVNGIADPVSLFCNTPSFPGATNYVGEIYLSVGDPSRPSYRAPNSNNVIGQDFYDQLLR